MTVATGTAGTEARGILGLTRGLASENTAMAVPDVKTPVGRASEHARMAAAAVPPASDRIGATAPGLPGGQGVWWTRSVPASAPESALLWHRARKPASLDASLLREADVQATLAGAWDDGFDAVMLKNYIRPGGKTPETVIVVRDPAQLRSPAAVFDPAKVGSSDLLAGIPALGFVPVAGALTREAGGGGESR